MKLFTFNITHPAAEDGTLVAVIPARNVEEARFLLDREFFFAQDTVNGYMFDVEFIRSASIPKDMTDTNSMRVHLPDGRVMEKAFARKN